MAIITKLSKKDFDNILSNYNIGEYRTSKHVSWALQNTLYILETTKSKYVLKIFEESSSNFIKFQIRIIDLLANKKIPVAKISKSKNDKELFIYKSKKIIIQKFLEGRDLKKLNNNLIKDIAKKMSLMSKYLLKIKLKRKYVWTIDHQFKSNPDADIINGVDFKKEENNLLKQMKCLNRKKLRISTIHGDFHDINLLVKNNKLKAILDWDDSHEDYLAHEIAVFVMGSFITQRKAQKDKIKLFFKEYQKYIKLRHEEKKAIYYFALQRFLGVIFWHKKQMKIHTDLKHRLQKNTKELIQNYFIFKKISLEEFLQLI